MTEKTYSLYFYRAGRAGEIGPMLEHQVSVHKSKADAVKTAKTIAEQNGWRFLEARPLN